MRPYSLEVVRLALHRVETTMDEEELEGKLVSYDWSGRDPIHTQLFALDLRSGSLNQNLFSLS